MTGQAREKRTFHSTGLALDLPSARPTISRTRTACTRQPKTLPTHEAAYSSQPEKLRNRQTRLKWILEQKYSFMLPALLFLGGGQAGGSVNSDRCFLLMFLYSGFVSGCSHFVHLEYVHIATKAGLLEHKALCDNQAIIQRSSRASSSPLSLRPLTSTIRGIIPHANWQ